MWINVPVLRNFTYYVNFNFNSQKLRTVLYLFCNTHQLFKLFSDPQIRLAYNDYGKITLRINGVQYQRHVVRKNKIYWHCPQYRSLGYVKRTHLGSTRDLTPAKSTFHCRCRARACSLNSESLKDVTVEIMEKEHNHGVPSQSRVRIEIKPEWKSMSSACPVKWMRKFVPIEFIESHGYRRTWWA